MIAAAIIIGLIFAGVCLLTFGLQAAILLLQLVMVIVGLIVQAGMALVWCVLWVFNRKAAEEAWAKSGADANKGGYP